MKGPRVTVVAGRKNKNGSRLKRATEVAALVHILCDTAKLSRVDPCAHVTQATIRVNRAPGAVELPSGLT